MRGDAARVLHYSRVRTFSAITGSSLFSPSLPSLIFCPFLSIFAVFLRYSKSVHAELSQTKYRSEGQDWEPL